MDTTVCAVNGCSNRKEGNSKHFIAFFKMPTNLQRLKQWIKACGRTHLELLLEVKGAHYIEDNFVVCSEHFEVHCFRNLNLRCQSLFPDAIPTLKLPGHGANAIKHSLLPDPTLKLPDDGPGASNYSLRTMNENGLKIDTICNICLSRDRDLHPMSTMMITQEWRDIGLNIKNGVLCWECRFFLNKVTCFKTKALLAQQVLKGKFMGSNVECLSGLGTAVNRKVIIFREETNPIAFDENDDDGSKLRDVIKVEAPDEHDIYYDEQEFEIDLEENFVGVENNTDFLVNIKEELVDENEKNNIINDDTHNVNETVDENIKEIKNPREEVDMRNSYVVCTLNEEELTNRRERERTMMRCSKSKWKCESCILAFRNKTKYNEHINQFHSQETGSFVCHICECRFRDEKALRSHTDNHHILYKCVLCKHARYYSKLSSMKYHIRINHGNEYVCKFCKRVFIISLTYHHKTHNTKKCPDCGKTVICLKSHMESHDTSPQECTICHKRLKSRKSLWSHMLTHTNTNKDETYCAECDMHFKNRYLYHIHLKYTGSHANADKECDYCHKKFTRKFTLAKHINLVHYNKFGYGCPTCEKLFKSRSSVNRHIKYVHNKMAMSKKYECIVCDRKFTVKRLLDNHMNSHTGNRPHKCELCESTFTQSGALYKHKQLVHKLVKAKSKS